MEPADRRFEPDRVDRVPNSPFEEGVPEVEERVDRVGRRLRPRLALPLPRNEP